MKLDIKELILLLPRYLIVTILAGIVMALLAFLVDKLSAVGTIGVIIASISTLVVYLLVLEIHPGVENILIDIIPLFLMAGILSTILPVLGITLALTVPTAIGMNFALAVVSLLFVDALYLTIVK